MSDFVTELRREVVGAHAAHRHSSARTRHRRWQPVVAGALALAVAAAAIVLAYRSLPAPEQTAEPACREGAAHRRRLDSIQAGWLSVKLRHLANWNKSRRELAHRYHELFADAKDSMILPREAAWTKGVYHLYVVRVSDREALQAHLAEAGIGTGIHYPIPLHMQKAYQYLNYKKGDFPVTERVAAEIVSLPMFPGLKKDQLASVANSVKEFVNSKVGATR